MLKWPIHGRQEQKADTMSEDKDKVEIGLLRDKVLTLSERLDKLTRHIPPVAEARARRNRFIYEVSGLAITAAGAWCVYPPASPLLVGGWMLMEVLMSRRGFRSSNKPNKDRSNA